MIADTKLYQELFNRKSSYIESVNKIFDYANKFLPKINTVFANYTGHGIEHSVSVMQYMYDLVTDISTMSDLEITCMICSALLHDIGMVVNEDEITKIETDALVCSGRKYSVIYQNLKNKEAALQECIRPTHGERSCIHILNMDEKFFLVPGYTHCNFQEELAKICQAHTMDREWIIQSLLDKQVKGSDSLNAQYIAMLLRIGDYLDIDEKRAPIELYKWISPTGFGDDEWKQHHIIENREKIVLDSISNIRKVAIYGECADSKIHRKILNYLSSLSNELMWCTSYSESHFEEKYRLTIDPNIHNNIQPKGFKISNLKMQIDYHAIVKLLMGENVYGNKKFGLRELIQNSVDACKVMMEKAEKMEKYQINPYIPKIQIILNYKKKEVIVLDNGTGMNNKIMKNYFLNIGKSYYKSADFRYRGLTYQPIGTFGIGFLACFMLSDCVTIETKHYLEKEGFAIELEADSEFACVKNDLGLIRDSGTAIILNLDSFFKVFENETANIKTFLERTFLNQDIEIQIVTIGDERIVEKLNLKKYEELNQGAIVLDSYLNGISASVQLDNNVKVNWKLSELCADGFILGKREFCTYNPANHSVCKTDIEGDKLREYINENRMAVFEIEGVDEIEKNNYDEWKKFQDEFSFPPHKMRKTIYFPVTYNKNLLKYIDSDSMTFSSGIAEWKPCNTEYFRKELCSKEMYLKNILKESGILTTATFSLKLGLISIIKVGEKRYIVYHDTYYGNVAELDNRTYWHGIYLEEGAMPIEAEVVGLNCGACVVNITSEDIIPNIARNDVPIDERRKIKNAIMRAMYQYVIDQSSDDEIKSALQGFIDVRYPSDNPYYKFEKDKQ